jgi:H+/gluconate symporter-like permease
MSALPGTPAIQNAIPMPFFGTTPFAAPGLGIVAAVVMFAFGMWWLGIAQARARKSGEGFEDAALSDLDGTGSRADDLTVRELASTAREFDPAEIESGNRTPQGPPIAIAVMPLAVVVFTNFIVTQVVLPRMDASFLAQPQWGETSLSSVGGIWSVSIALFLAILVLIALNMKRLPALRSTIDAGANASVLPVISVASLVGFGAVVAALPAFEAVRDWVLGIGGGPLVSLAVATNILAALTGSASGGMTIALDALGPTFMQIAHDTGLSPSLMHRVAVIASGTLDSLPHNGAVVTMLAVCGCNHRESYLDIVMVAVVSAMLALIAVIVLGSVFGSF